MPYEDQIMMSGPTAEGLSLGLDQDFNKVETPERMAWIVLLLRFLEDTPDIFPKGKWATIQHLERQLEDAAKNQIERGW